METYCDFESMSLGRKPSEWWSSHFPSHISALWVETKCPLLHHLILHITIKSLIFTVLLSVLRMQVWQRSTHDFSPLLSKGGELIRSDVVRNETASADRMLSFSEECLTHGRLPADGN